jgi:molecular chaperone HtpG
VHELLATIGRSSERDELGFARHEFLGQFGIGLLSCFMVADEIRVLTRYGENPTVLWTGFADGRYTVATASPQEHRGEPGTTVVLVPRVGAEHWLAEKAVVDLVRYYGGLLPVGITVGSMPITEAPAPWQTGVGESAPARRARLAAYCREVFGFEPFDVVEIAAAEAGVRGVAFVLPVPANPTVAAAHRIYLKQMLLSTIVKGLLPEWAFLPGPSLRGARRPQTSNSPASTSCGVPGIPPRPRSAPSARSRHWTRPVLRKHWPGLVRSWHPCIFSWTTRPTPKPQRAGH